MFIQFDLDDTSMRQIFISDIVVNNTARSVRFEFRYLETPNHWTVSMLDAATDEALCLNVPVVTSYTLFNDLLRMYRYKGLGSMICAPSTDNPGSIDPRLDNVGEFTIVWGDDFES